MDKIPIEETITVEIPFIRGKECIDESVSLQENLKRLTSDILQKSKLSSVEALENRIIFKFTHLTE